MFRVVNDITSIVTRNWPVPGYVDQNSESPVRGRLWVSGASALLLLSFLSLSACGYQFSGVGRLPGEAQQVHVAIMENPTAETGIEVVLTNDLIQELMRNGHPIAPNPEKADSVLSGRISDLRIDTIARQSAHTSVTGRVALSLDLALMDAEGQRVWSAKGITKTQAYDIVSDSKLATEENRLVAIKSISRRLAETIYDRLTAGF